MRRNPDLFDEKYMRYIQEMLNVSRRELVETIRISRTSAERIAKYIRKNNMAVPRPHFA